jgi:hypothetical protein
LFYGFSSTDAEAVLLNPLSEIYAGRFPFLTSVPGMLFLRASCFTSRVCLRIPLEGRLVLVLTVDVLNCVAPLGVACVFGFVFFPEFANFLSGFLTGISVFDLKHVDEFIELRFCFVDF